MDALGCGVCRARHPTHRRDDCGCGCDDWVRPPVGVPPPRQRCPCCPPRRGHGHDNGHGHDHDHGHGHGRGDLVHIRGGSAIVGAGASLGLGGDVDASLDGVWTVVACEEDDIGTPHVAYVGPWWIDAACNGVAAALAAACNVGVVAEDDVEAVVAASAESVPAAAPAGDSNDAAAAAMAVDVPNGVMLLHD